MPEKSQRELNIKLLEGSVESVHPVYMCFVDLKVAYVHLRKQLRFESYFRLRFKVVFLIGLLKLDEDLLMTSYFNHIHLSEYAILFLFGCRMSIHFL